MEKSIVFFILMWAVNCEGQGTWHNLDGGVTCDTNIGNCYPVVYTICADTINNVLYVGGNFNRAGNFVRNSVAQWDGTKWDSIQQAIAYEPDAMIMYKGNLYVGDELNGDVTIFDGDNWHIIPGVFGEVYCFTIYKDTLYAGGAFTTNDKGDTLNNIAKWNGTDWRPLGVGIGGVEVNAMSVYDDTLFAGGYFHYAGSKTANSIAKWDGTNWGTLGGGIKDWINPGFVFSMDTFQNKLYVGGEYDSAGGITAYSLASWNGKVWDSLTSQPSTYQYALKSFDGYLFMSGLIGTNDVENIAKYDGNVITTLDSGVNHIVYSLASWNGSLYVGGEFDTVEKIVAANHIARWTPVSSTGINQLISGNNQLTISPNPFTQETTVQLVSGNRKPWQFILQDLLGRTVAQYNVTQTSFIIPRNNLPAGLYIATAKTDDGQLFGKTKLMVQ